MKGLQIHHCNVMHCDYLKDGGNGGGSAGQRDGRRGGTMSCWINWYPVDPSQLVPSPPGGGSAGQRDGRIIITIITIIMIIKIMVIL